jgi:ribose transport system permease protein
MFGAVVGALDIFLIENILTYYQINSFVEQMVYGAILVVAVCVNRTVDARMNRVQ